MSFGLTIPYYHSLQYRPVFSCSSSTYGDVIWYANSTRVRSFSINMGYYDGTASFDYLVDSGSAMLSVVYNNQTTSITNIVNTGGSASWYYTYNGVTPLVSFTLESRQNNNIDQWFRVKSSYCITTSTTTTTTTTPQYSVDWNYANSAFSGYLEILVNGATIVYASSNNGGTIYINPGDTLSTYVYTQATNPLIAEAGLYITENSSVIYSNTNQGQPSISDSYGIWTPSANVTIDGTSNEF